MPLFVVEALGVELLALALRPERGGALRFGAAAGLLCGTVGFAAQYAWTQVWAPVPWTPSLLAEGLPTAVLAGVAGGLLGALLGAGLRRELPVRAVRRVRVWQPPRRWSPSAPTRCGRATPPT